MSFCSDLGEILDTIWPLIEDHGEAVDGITMSFDFASGYIEVTVELDDGSSANAAIGWKEDIPSLIEELQASIRNRASDVSSSVEEILRHAEEDVAEKKAFVKVLKNLVPTPLEELAQQAE